MKKRHLYLLAFILCASYANAQEYTTFLHLKDGRIFAIATDHIDSITHSAEDIDASYYNLTDSIVYPSYTAEMNSLLLRVASGASNSELCREANMDALFAQNARYEREGEEWTHPGMFTLIDDDVIDEFIPSSYAGQSISDSDKKVGGYFSLLYPFLKSLEVKYDVNLTCGLSVEGQRVGLTNYWSEQDECKLNENGQLVQQLTRHTGWECLCHSMTARISPERSVCIVDSLTSHDAKEILTNGRNSGAFSFSTAGVYDRLTGKNYTISADRTTWIETPTKYIQPYCYDKKTGQWIYNDTYPIDYQLGEWKRRADSLGFVYPDILVYCGNTTAAPLIRASREYFSHSVDPGMSNGVNNIPLGATVHRISAIAGKNNAYNEERYKMLKQAVDDAAATNGWLVIMSHFNTKYYYNGYLDEIDYPEKDANYNAEWINPLVTDEIMNMDENNYWDNPPARLGIDNWGEWHPAKGTQLWALYKIFGYAIEKQLQNVSPSEGVKITGNKVNIGTYRDHGLYPREKEMELKPIDRCYYVVGADGSIRYESYK